MSKKADMNLIRFLSYKKKPPQIQNAHNNVKKNKLHFLISVINTRGRSVFCTLLLIFLITVLKNWPFKRCNFDAFACNLNFYYKYLNKNTLFTQKILFIEEYVEIKFNIWHHSLSLLHIYILKISSHKPPSAQFFPILKFSNFIASRIKIIYWTKCMKRFNSVLILALNEDLKINIWR